jgi:hypothetical protein
MLMYCIKGRRFIETLATISFSRRIDGHNIGLREKADLRW